MAFPRSPRTSSAFQSTRSRVLDTTYFFAASIVRAKGSIQCIGLVEALERVTMQVFVREHYTMIAASVQCDVDVIPKGSDYVKVPFLSGWDPGRAPPLPFAKCFTLFW